MTTKIIVIVGASIATVVLMFVLGRMADGKSDDTEKKRHRAEELSSEAMTTWLIVAALALILLGPKQMPSAVRKIARMMGKLQRMSDEFKRQMMSLDRKIENEVESSLKDSSSEA